MNTQHSSASAKEPEDRFPFMRKDCSDCFDSGTVYNKTWS